MSKKQVPNKSTKLAGTDFNVSDYEKLDQTARGLAVTHEQVSDTYAEGEIHPTVERENRQ
jgi:hypothetical protein